MEEHNVEFDYAGFGEHPRLTCYSCENKTLVKEPYMTLKDWRELVELFVKQHPSKCVTAYWERIKPDER